LSWKAQASGNSAPRLHYQAQSNGQLDKCQNIHILAVNLHWLISKFLLFCSILFPFSVFCVFVGHGRKGSVSGNLNIKG
jgi:nitrate reductase gamma subunit